MISAYLIYFLFSMFFTYSFITSKFCYLQKASPQFCSQNFTCCFLKSYSKIQKALIVGARKREAWKQDFHYEEKKFYYFHNM